MGWLSSPAFRKVPEGFRKSYRKRSLHVGIFALSRLVGIWIASWRLRGHFWASRKVLRAPMCTSSNPGRTPEGYRKLPGRIHVLCGQESFRSDLTTLWRGGHKSASQVANLRLQVELQIVPQVVPQVGCEKAAVPEGFRRFPEVLPEAK